MSVEEDDTVDQLLGSLTSASATETSLDGDITSDELSSDDDDMEHAGEHGRRLLSRAKLE